MYRFEYYVRADERNFRSDSILSGMDAILMLKKATTIPGNS
ncbi:hypothetical protein ACFL6K_03165 [Candidatus Latescibacterota bacterium]